MLLLTLALGFAQAQETDIELNSQLFHPTIDGSRTIWTDDSGKAESGTAIARMVFSYTNRPFIFESSPGAQPVALVSDALQANALVGYTLGPVRLGVDLPIYLYTAGQQEDGGAGIGDLSIDGKVSLLHRANGLGLALGGRVKLDTASVDLALGESSTSGEIFAIADTEVNNWLFTTNLGARFLPTVQLTNVDLGDQLFARIGVGYQVVEDAGLSLDVVGHTNLSAKLSNPASSPIEGMLGGWYRVAEPFVLRAGAGTGFTRGVGSPVFRSVISLGYEPSGQALDTDGDGISDKNDNCISDPEDIDAWEDIDGCPDPDNDVDGILDINDSCMNEPEDYDGWEDEDGCPDTATQVTFRVEDPNGNLIPTVSTQITGTGTDHTNGSEFQLILEPGLYSVDAMADGYTPVDARVNIPEFEPFSYTQVLVPDVPMGRLRIRVISADGESVDNAFWFIEGQTPTPVTDAEVGMPPGDYPIQIRAEGFAPSTAQTAVTDGDLSRILVMLQPSRIEMVGERINLREKVQFATNRATIKEGSFPLLDEVATTMNDHPELLKIRIEGHTDERGSASYNLDLSDRRAAAVLRYLEDRGVASGRMESAGVGEQRPLDPTSNAAAWETNRRVEVSIIERAD
ncbi:MAG: outer membrane protein OmpA-like peptidoglycan-associated protein [Myxococcota bacterium]|jgi:OOP family OmpA-OmpF porin